MGVTIGSIPPFPFAVACILVGSAFITYILGFLDLDLTPFLHSKPGKFVLSVSERIHKRCLQALSVSNPTVPPPVPLGISSRAYLETLPVRSGPRPIVSGYSHLQQTTQLPCLAKGSEIPSRLRDIITDISLRHLKTTYLGSSTFDADGPITLYARQRIFNETRYYGEIIHADRATGLIGCTLHPNDVIAVIEKGWGQRHPFSTRLSSCLSMGRSRAGPSPESRVILYAPRSQADLEVVERIIGAAVWWVGGVDSQIDDEKA